MISVAISLTNKETIYSNVNFKDKQDFVKYLNNYDYIMVIERSTKNEVIINAQEIVCVR